MDTDKEDSLEGVYVRWMKRKKLLHKQQPFIYPLK